MNKTPVKRWRLCDPGYGSPSAMIEVDGNEESMDEDVHYVKASDYEALESDAARLRGSVEEGRKLLARAVAAAEETPAWNRRHHPGDATAMVAPRLWDADSIKDAPDGPRYAVGIDGVYLATVTKDAVISALSMPGWFAYGPLPLPGEGE